MTGLMEVIYSADGFILFHTFIAIPLLLVFLIYSVGYMASNVRLLRKVKKYLLPSSKRWPSVAVLAPFKGLEPHMEQNISALLSQDYPSSWEVIFVSDSLLDPAYDTIKRMIDARRGVKARIFKAPKAEVSSQKITNLLTALREVPRETEVLVFIDSDVQISGLWLRSLVSALDGPKVGASTGYRLFHSEGGFWKGVCSLWDSTHLLSVGRIIFPWGGSMAIRQDLFKQLDVETVWQESLSDDVTLAHILKEKGLRVAFAPNACGQTEPPTGGVHFLRWATRQMVMIRLYAGWLWRANLFGLISHHLLLGIGIIMLFGGWLKMAPLVLIASRVAGGLIRREAMGVLSVDMDFPLAPFLLDPLIPTLGLFLWISAWLTKDLEWRGITYHVKNFQRKER